MNSKKLFILLPIAMMSFSLCAFVGANSFEKPQEGVTVVMPDVGYVPAAKPAYVPTDSNYSTLVNTYHMSPDGIGNIEAVWDSYRGDSIKVAIIDNGIDMDHPDFKDALGNSIISQSSMYIKGNDSNNQITYYTLSSFPTCLNHNYDVASTSNHGTNVAATVAAAINGVGGVGIAPNVELIIFRTAYRYYEVQYALQQCLSLGVDVINMSFASTSSGWSNLSSDYKKLNNAGTIICAAAGNDNTSTATYPAHTNYVIGVGALADNQEFTTKASYSNYNSESSAGTNNVDIVAPGQVYVADGSGNGTHTYKSTHGTSFASPIVAGAAALWKEANPGGNQTQFENDLFSTSISCDSYPWSQTFGYGRIDIAGLIGSTIPVTGVDLSPSSTTISAGASAQLSYTITPSNATNKNVTFTSSNTGVATVSSTGLVSGLSAGTTAITVTTNNGFTDTCEVTVTGSIVHVTGVSIQEGATASININDNLQLHSSITPSNATDKSVLWIADDESICTVNEDTGLVHGVAKGTTNVTVITIDGEYEASIAITVREPAPVSNTWILVEDVSQLSAGSKVVFAAINGSSNYVAGSFSSGYFSSLNSGTTFSSDKKTITELSSSASQFILGRDGTDTYWTVSQVASPSNKLVGTSAARSLQLANNSATNTWTISVDGSANATVASSNSSYGRILYNVSSPRFLNYTSSTSTTMLLPRLYVNGSAGTVDVTGVSVSPTSTSLDVGHTTQLTPTVTPGNATNKDVTYSSNNTSVATVDSTGLVTAVATGSATITVTTVDGGFTATCAVTVMSAPALTRIFVTGASTTPVPFGGTYDTSSIVVTAEYERGDDRVVTSSAVIGEPNTKILGTQAVEVSYTENGVTKTTSYNVDVTNVGSCSEAKRATITIGSGSGDISSSNVTSHYTLNSESDFSITSHTITGYITHETTGFRFGSNSKAGSWVMTLNKAQPITQIKITCQVYGSDASSITVNGSSQSAPSTLSDLTFNISDATTASISISASTSKKRFYVSAIEITYGQGGGGAPTTYTAQEQATAWGNWFMSKTNEVCDVTGVSTDVNALKTLWTSLKREYEAMYSGSKSYFVEDLVTSQAMKRYEWIVSKYGTTDFDPFITDGNGTEYVIPESRYIDLGSEQETISVVILIVPMIILGVGLGYTLYKKRKEN